MDDCTRLAPLVTAWVDGSIDPETAPEVGAHVAACPACSAEASRERGVRRLLENRREVLTRVRAPEALVARLQVMRPDSATAVTRRTWLRAPVAVAATLVLAASGVTLHVATGRSTTVLAAQLAADHAKCHLTGRFEQRVDPATARDRLAARYGLHADVPPGTADGRLRLVGAKRCLTGDGTNAHILYRYDGRPVSLYLLPKEARPEQSVEVFGDRAYVWSRHNGTYVLVADARVAGLLEVVSYMQQATR
jgi:anti-sigma factor RsiW